MGQHIYFDNFMPAGDIVLPVSLMNVPVRSWEGSRECLPIFTTPFCTKVLKMKMTRTDVSICRLPTCRAISIPNLCLWMNCVISSQKQHRDNGFDGIIPTQPVVENR